MEKRLSNLESDKAEEAAIRQLKQKRRLNTPSSRPLILVFCTMAGVEFSTVLPSLWIYVQELSAPSPGNDTPLSPVTVQLLSQVAFIASATCFKLTCGWLADRGPLAPLFTACTVCGALGGLMYGLARVFGGVKSLLVARLVMGGAGGLSTVSNTYTVRTAQDIGERTSKLASNAACTLVGVLIGPAVVPIFSLVSTTCFGLKVDQANLPGLFLFAVFSMLTAIRPCLMHEPPLLSGTEAEAADGASLPTASTAPAPATASMRTVNAAATGATSTGTSNGNGGSSEDAYLAVCPQHLSLLLDLSLSCTFACVMYSTTPIIPLITEASFGWGPVRNSYFFLGIALFTLSGVLFTGSLLKARTPPWPILLASCTVLLLHELIAAAAETLIFRTPTTFTLWLATIAISYASLNGSVAAQVTLTVPSTQTGTWIGIAGVIESIGQAVGPLVLQLFGAGEEKVALTHVLSRSRLALGAPTALILVGHATRAIGQLRANRVPMV